MTKQMILIETITGQDLRNEKVTHLKVTPFYLDGSTYRLGIKILPESTADPEVEERLKKLWREMIERSDDL